MSSIEVPERLDALDEKDTAIPEKWKLHHVWRYNFAKRFVKNKVIIDVACGYGYGSFILSKAAKEVFAIDVANCFREKYKNKKITFIRSDAKKIPLKDNAIDVAVSFETLEHLFSPEIFLREIYRLLHNKGLLILSVPNKLHSSANAPYHIRDFGRGELEDILKNAGFKILHFGGQNFNNLPFFYIIENRFPRLTIIRSYLGFLFPNQSTVFLTICKKI